MPQDRNSAASWPQNLQHDPMNAGIGDEDFTKFLDLDNGFEQFQTIDSSHGHSSLETPMGRLAFGRDTQQDLTAHNQGIMQSIDMSAGHRGDLDMYVPGSSMGSEGQQQYQQYQMYQQIGQPHRYQVPPTPVSAEMQASKYGGQIDNTGQIVFDRHQASFTPLVSPAQTPLDTTFYMPDYVVADDFFSPLTSPAIEAQPHFASTNTTASPVDLNADHSASNTPNSTTRKRGRNADLSQPRRPRSVKQSPGMKPQQKRRQFSLTTVPHEKLETMLESSEQDDRLRPEPGQGNVFASSEDSLSPEPLSEALMRPPPIPSHAGRSPVVLQPPSADTSLPATPAMIMRMPSKQAGPTRQSSSRTSPVDVMEDIALPDAATALSSTELSHIHTTIATDDQITPTLSAKTPKLSAASTPRASTIKTQNNSTEATSKMKRIESKISSRGGKKKQSVSTATVSPALRPKISPSISPLALAPGPGMSNLSAETSALFLASKSNYQNILDGTHLPGVSYPETLAENLSSKRTSHKIAEQGRRNRINLALKEIESLLPSSITAGPKKEKGGSGSKDSEDGSPEKPASSSSSSAQSASKASTVEMAIMYIRNLQAELQETKEKLEAAEKTIAQSSSSKSHSPE